MMPQALSFSRNCRRGLGFAACLLAFSALQPHATAQTYTFQPLYDFPTSGITASHANGQLAIDAQGNLYGASQSGGENGWGAVFELVDNGGTYTEQVLLYSFTGGDDGADPIGGVVMDRSGNLFGAAQGAANQDGVVWELVNNNGTYAFKVLHAFGGSDGEDPQASLAMDASGNLFGTTAGGGSQGLGTVFEVENEVGTGYDFRVLHSFVGATDGSKPESRVLIIGGTNLYGTTSTGGIGGGGTAWMLTGGPNTMQILHSFDAATDGVSGPIGGLVMDASGNLIGTTELTTPEGLGAVFELVNSSGSYSLKILHQFSGVSGDGATPVKALSIDPNGNIFGTTAFGGTSEFGTVFEMANAAGGYTERTLYDFPGGNNGSDPSGPVLIDPLGNLYGVTAYNTEGVGSPSTFGPGVVWELEGPAVSTTLALTSGANPVFQGDDVNLMAAIATTPANKTVTGTVTFTEGPTVLGTAIVYNNTAYLSVPASTLSVGADTISAQFIPGAANVSGSSNTMSETVNSASDIATLNGGNAFNGNQTVNGTVTATSFTGSLNCLGCIGNTQLGVGYAGSASKGGPAANSLLFGGFPPGSYVMTGSNTFTGDQTINGNLNVTGAVNTGSLVAAGNVRGASLAATGSLSIGGGTAIKQYLSMTDSIKLPRLHKGDCTTFTTAALTGFTPGSSDTIALGIPASFRTGLNESHDRDHDKDRKPGPPIVLGFQAWETSASPGTTLTVQVCNFSNDYQGGAAGTVRIDVFKH
ncbi:MAG TPA: choice-of-anchor tandem repeat GloVer-containing protein [Terracidiphilus sp.]|nr:choice-of-anchor tandem repeat GloVer-containing protein [Terracidiphilus sp.]